MAEFEETLNHLLSSPEAMGQIMALADSLSGKNAAAEPGALEAPSDPENNAPVPASGDGPLSLFANLDPKLLQKIMVLLAEYNRSDDEKIALLNAIRPFLTEDRQPKLDKAMQITRLARVIRAALQEFGRDSFV